MDKGLLTQMGLVYADVELINAVDFNLSNRSIINTDIPRIKIKVVVDWKVFMMSINKAIRDVLDLPCVEYRKVKLASGEVVEYEW